MTCNNSSPNLSQKKQLGPWPPIVRSVYCQLAYQGLFPFYLEGKTHVNIYFTLQIKKISNLPSVEGCL